MTANAQRIIATFVAVALTALGMWKGPTAVAQVNTAMLGALALIATFKILPPKVQPYIDQLEVALTQHAPTVADRIVNHAENAPLVPETK